MLLPKSHIINYACDVGRSGWGRDGLAELRERGDWNVTPSLFNSDYRNKKTSHKRKRNWKENVGGERRVRDRGTL